MKLPLLPLRSYCNGQSLPMGWPVSPSGRLPSQLNTSHGSKTARPRGGAGVSSPSYLLVTIQIGGRVFSRCDVTPFIGPVFMRVGGLDHAAAPG